MSAGNDLVVSRLTYFYHWNIESRALDILCCKSNLVRWLVDSFMKHYVHTVNHISIANSVFHPERSGAGSVPIKFLLVLTYMLNF